MHEITIEIGRFQLNVERHVDGIARQDAGRVRPVDLTGSSDCPEQCPVKGYNGSIFMEAINRRGSRPWLRQSTLGDFVSMLESA